jgi:hypothetical protein
LVPRFRYHPAHRLRTLGPEPLASGVDVVDAPAPYFHWGFILISLPNVILILVMVLLFVAALVLPFPRHGKKAGSPRGNDDE